MKVNYRGLTAVNGKKKKKKKPVGAAFWATE
jgi:hypothetical protein